MAIGVDEAHIGGWSWLAPSPNHLVPHSLRFLPLAGVAVGADHAGVGHHVGLVAGRLQVLGSGCGWGWDGGMGVVQVCVFPFFGGVQNPTLTTHHSPLTTHADLLPTAFSFLITSQII